MENSIMELEFEKQRIDVNIMCRLCHHRLDTDKSVEIFADESSTSLPISVQIKIFAGIEVTSADAFPKQLCLECRLHLEKSNLWRNKCKTLDLKMRKHFRLITAGRMSHVFDEDSDGEEEYSESVKIIDALSRQLAAIGENASAKPSFELEKKRLVAEFEEANRACEERLAQAIEQFEAIAEKLKQVEAKARFDQDELKKYFEEKLKDAETDLEIQRREAKLEREDVVREMTAAHAAELKRVKDEAEEKMFALRENQQMKRKKTEPELETIALNGDLVSVAVPVADQQTYTILETGELELVEFLPYPEEDKEEDKKVHPCAVCEKEFTDTVFGKFHRERNDIRYDFCSNSCAIWFDTINDAKILLKDDYTEAEYNAWLAENGPVTPFVLPKEPKLLPARQSRRAPLAQRPPKAEPKLQWMPMSSIHPPVPSASQTPKPSTSQSHLMQRPRHFENVFIKQEVDDLSQYVHGDNKFCSACKKNIVNGGLSTVHNNTTLHFCNPVCARTKQCFTCKKAIVVGGVTAERGNFVANFCNSVCLSRASSTSAAPQTIATGPRFAANANGLRGPKFYCQICDQPYTQKYSLKRHFVGAHSGHVFNNNIVAQNRSDQ